MQVRPRRRAECGTLARVVHALTNMHVRAVRVS
jgi:hypothetical protein